MNPRRTLLLPVSLFLGIGMIGCEMEPAAEQPDAAIGISETILGKLDVAGEPKAAAEKPVVTEKQLPSDSPLPAIAPLDADQARQHQQAWAAYLIVPVEHANSIGMRLRLIPAGEFMMGSPESDVMAGAEEKPQHRVRITKPFYLGVCEVTQEQYEKVAGENPSEYAGAANPVEMVSWDEAVEFCERLSALEGVTYRLPTEAEWEHACRAGTTTQFSFDDDMASLDEYAWYGENSGGKTHAVGAKKPNAWGLHDMHGKL